MTVKINPLALDSAYLIKATGTYDQLAFEKNFTNNHEGWGIIARSIDIEINNDHLLKSAAYFNRDSKTIIIATVGSNFTLTKQGYHDVIDDAFIATGNIVPKFNDVKQFMDSLIDLVGRDELNEYKIITTGHSLGSVLSDLTAVYAKYKGLNVSESITFDNPGSRPIIEKLLKKPEYKKFTVDNLKSEINFETYTAAPNIVNTCNKQMGTHYFATKAQPEKNTYYDNIYELITSSFDITLNAMAKAVNIFKDFFSNNLEHELVRIIDRLENPAIYRVSNKDWLKEKITVKLDKKYATALEEVDKNIIISHLKSKEEKEYIKFTSTEDSLFKLSTNHIAKYFPEDIDTCVAVVDVMEFKSDEYSIIGEVATAVAA
jgi:hypothetical protein